VLVQIYVLNRFELRLCFHCASLAARHEIPTHRPRLLLVGEKGQGHSSHLGPAILHHFESLPVYVLDLPALYAVGMKSPEEACSQVHTAVYETRRHLCRLLLKIRYIYC